MKVGVLRIKLADNLVPPVDNSLPLYLGGNNLRIGTDGYRHTDAGELWLRRIEAHKLGVRAGDKLGFFEQAAGVKLGPVLGILTAGQGRVPGNREMFRFVQNAASSSGMLSYVFVPEDVMWRRGLVRGYQYRRGQWRESWFPLPDVVYNRVPNRRLEESISVRQLKRRLRTSQIPYFNPSYLNKYDLYRILRQETRLKPYLPWTKQVANLGDVRIALRRFGVVYLKPKYAFAGKGIMQVRVSNNGWIIRYRTVGRNKQIRAATWTQLSSILSRSLGNKAYIVQQGIVLARFRGRIFDVRLLAQKNGSGKWQVSGMGVRVAGVGGITTHVPNGGYVAAIEQVLPVVFGDRWQEIQTRIYQLAMQVVPCIEKGMRTSFGEMSMDIGVDRQGHPWFFEANAKPMRFDEHRIRQRGLQNLVAYSKYLAGVGTGGEIL